jgi:hypothetical protein
LSRNLFVNLTSNSHHQEDYENTVLEPIFQLSTETRLNIGYQFSDLNTVDFFSHQIARNPENLRNQAQRILYLIAQKESERICGALIDLFIAVGVKGTPFKTRMLEISRIEIKKEAYSFFKSKLTTGIKKTDVIPFSKFSILSKGIKGSCKLVQKAAEKNETETEKKPIQIAQDYLKSGNVTIARTVLEKAIILETQNKILHKQLLEIYRGTKDFHHFNEMFKKLNKDGMLMKGEWIEMEKHLKIVAQ